MGEAKSHACRKSIANVQPSVQECYAATLRRLEKLVPFENIIVLHQMRG